MAPRRISIGAGIAITKRPAPAAKADVPVSSEPKKKPAGAGYTPANELEKKFQLRFAKKFGVLPSRLDLAAFMSRWDTDRRGLVGEYKTQLVDAVKTELATAAEIAQESRELQRKPCEAFHDKLCNDRDYLDKELRSLAELYLDKSLDNVVLDTAKTLAELAVLIVTAFLLNLARAFLPAWLASVFAGFNNKASYKGYSYPTKAFNDIWDLTLTESDIEEIKKAFSGPASASKSYGGSWYSPGPKQEFNHKLSPCAGWPTPSQIFQTSWQTPTPSQIFQTSWQTPTLGNGDSAFAGEISQEAIASFNAAASKAAEDAFKAAVMPSPVLHNTWF